MWLLTHIFAIGLTLAIWALAAILIHYALALADDRRVRQVPVSEPDIDLGQPEPEPGSEREANLLLARGLAEGDGNA